MTEEIEIKIECLYAKRYEVQLAILKPSEQGRWPSDKEFLAMGTLVDGLRTVQTKIDVLEEILDSIRSNAYINEMAEVDR